jgi:catechol 2,3-dioxygenase-like lactoylglutathione lyase family enzyme
VDSKRFYAGIAPAVALQTRDLGERLQLIAQTGTFSILAGPPTENLHLAIGVDNKEAVRDFHGFGLPAGGRDNGTPGERPHYHAGYYSAYLLDPDSNNIETVFHNWSS